MESSRAVTDHPQRNGLVVLLAIATLAWFGIALLDTINFAVDDTFISMRYSENFALGRGLVYNVGERVEGYSNPLWTVMLGLFARAGWSQVRSDLALLQVAKVAGGLFALGTLLVLAALTRWIARRGALGRLSPLTGLAVVGTVATYSFTLWAMSGLETAMCAFFLTAALAAHFVALARIRDGERPNGLLVLGGIAFGLVTWVRPEQPFAWAGTMLVFSMIASPRERSAIPWSAVPTLVLYGALEAFRFAYYHGLVANSVVAKTGGGVASAILGAKYMLAAVGGTIGIVALGLCGLPALLRGRREWQFLALYCAAMLGLLGVSGGDWMPGFRLLVPIAPMLWLLALSAALVLLGAPGRDVPAPLVVAIVLVFAAAQFADGRKAVRAEQPFATGFKGVTWTSSRERIAIAKQLRSTLPPHSTLAVFEAGYVPYYCPDLRIQDDSGLNDAEIARLPGRHMYKLTSDVFLRRRPDYFLALITIGGTGIPPSDLMMLERDPRFHDAYEVASRATAGERVLATTAGGAAAVEERMSYVLYRRRDLAPAPGGAAR